KTVTPEAIKISDTSPIINPAKVEIQPNAENPVNVTGDIAQLFGASENIKEPVKFAKKDGEIISAETPLEIPMIMEDPVVATELRIAPSELGLDNAATKGSVLVTNDLDEVQSYDFDLKEAVSYLFLTDEASPSTIVIDLRGQTAIKKVTIRVTETTKASSNLVEISKVQFLNNTKDQIVEQVASIPTNLKVTSGNKSLSLSWEAQQNVTGYEVKMSFINPKSGEQETVVTPVDGTSLEINELINFVEYKISVQSINHSKDGNWESGYCAPIIGIPLPTDVPEQPEGITTTGGYRQITVNWEKQKNSTGYNVYYREKGQTEYNKIAGLTTTSQVIADLKNETEYEIYLTGYNAIGEGAKSPVYRCETKSIDPPITSNYKLINLAKGVNEPTEHIKDVTYPYLKESDYEKPFDKYDIVDNDYTSYWNFGG
ncbi:MAG: fibronectin type III domain-containing protein, partial [Eubacterium sp.]